MTVRIQHPFRSTKQDGDDPTQVQPSYWNADHQVTLQGPALLGRKDGTDESAQEVNVGAGLLLTTQGLLLDRTAVVPVWVSGISGLNQIVRAMLGAGWSASGWQWYRKLLTAEVNIIAGATSALYVQQAEDVVPGVEIFPRPLGLVFTPSGLVAPGTVVPVPLTISGTPVLSAAVGVAYAGFTVAAAGGTVPYTYSVIGGPAGMTVSDQGVVTYATPAQGTYIGIVIRATASSGAHVDLPAFTLTVSAVAKPVNLTLPLITGDAVVDQTLHLSNGTWSGNPTSFTYIWRRSGTVITSLTTPDALMLAAYVGAGFTGTVIATNAGGASDPATSLPTANVTASTRARFGYGSATAGVGGTAAALFASMTKVANATTDRNGQMVSAPGAGLYTWVAVLASAAGAGVTFTDSASSTTGVFSGALSAGPYFGLDSTPTTEHQTYTDGTGNVWWLFRSDLANTAATFNLS